MKHIKLLLSGLLLTAIIMLSGCSSPTKLYQKGDYYGACQRAISNLKSKPSDEESKNILSEAYLQLVSDIDRQAQMASPINTVRKCEIMIANYNRLNKIYDEIMHTPGAMSVIANPVNRRDEVTQLKLTAAEILYTDGTRALQMRTIDQARIALNMFKRVNSYAPGYKDVAALIREATYEATLRVVVLKPVVQGRYSLDTDFFYSKLMQDINRRSYRTLTRFYTPEEAKQGRVTPHQLLAIEFIDFVVGNTQEKEQTTDVKKDNIELNKGVFGTASGKYTLYTMNIISRGALGMSVVNPTTNKVMNQKRFDSQSVWSSRWATFRGDDRALSNEQKSLLNRRPQAAPSPQHLFASFAEPLFAQAADFIKMVYPFY